MKKIILIIVTLFILNGCSNLSPNFLSWDHYKSDVKFIILNKDGSTIYPVSTSLWISSKRDYFSYIYDAGNIYSGISAIQYIHSHEMIEKLTLFIKWSNLSYEDRLKELDKVEKQLPNNNPKQYNKETSTTDFFFFHDKNNNPYLSFERDTSFIYPSRYISINPDNARKMIIEIYYYQQMAREYQGK